MGGSWDHVFEAQIVGGIIWLVLVFVALVHGGWRKNLFWLFVLVPVAFGPPLLVLWLWISANVGGFAP